MEESDENIETLMCEDPFEDSDSLLHNGHDETGETNFPRRNCNLLNDSPIVIEDDDVDDSLHDINNSGIINVRNKMIMPILEDQITVSDDSEDGSDSDLGIIEPLMRLNKNIMYIPTKNSNLFKRRKENNSLNLKKFKIASSATVNLPLNLEHNCMMNNEIPAGCSTQMPNDSLSLRLKSTVQEKQMIYSPRPVQLSSNSKSLKQSNSQRLSHTTGGEPRRSQNLKIIRSVEIPSNKYKVSLPDKIHDLVAQSDSSDKDDTSEKFISCEYENCGTLVDDRDLMIDDLYCSLKCKIRKQTVTEEEQFIDETSNPTEKTTVDHNILTKLEYRINKKKQLLKTSCPDKKDNSKEQPLVEDKDVLKYMTGFQHKSAPIQFFDKPYPDKKSNVSLSLELNSTVQEKQTSSLPRSVQLSSNSEPLKQSNNPRLSHTTSEPRRSQNLKILRSVEKSSNKYLVSLPDKIHDLVAQSDSSDKDDTSEKFISCEYENCGTLVDDRDLMIDDLYCSLKCKIRKQTVTEKEQFNDETSNPTEKTTVDHYILTKLEYKINKKKQLLKTSCPDKKDNSKEQPLVEDKDVLKYMTGFQHKSAPIQFFDKPYPDKKSNVSLSLELNSTVQEKQTSSLPRSVQLSSNSEPLKQSNNPRLSHTTSEPRRSQNLKILRSVEKSSNKYLVSLPDKIHDLVAQSDCSDKDDTSEKFISCEYENCGTLVDDRDLMIDDLYCSLKCKIRKQTVTEEEQFIDETSNPTEKTTVDHNILTKLEYRINKKKQLLKTSCPDKKDNSKEQPLVEDKDVLKYMTGFQHKSAPIQFFDKPYPDKKSNVSLSLELNSTVQEKQTSSLPRSVQLSSNSEPLKQSNNPRLSHTTSEPRRSQNLKILRSVEKSSNKYLVSLPDKIHDLVAQSDSSDKDDTSEKFISCEYENCGTLVDDRDLMIDDLYCSLKCKIRKQTVTEKEQFNDETSNPTEKTTVDHNILTKLEYRINKKKQLLKTSCPDKKDNSKEQPLVEDKDVLKYMTGFQHKSAPIQFFDKPYPDKKSNVSLSLELNSTVQEKQTSSLPRTVQLSSNSEPLKQSNNPRLSHTTSEPRRSQNLKILRSVEKASNKYLESLPDKIHDLVAQSDSSDKDDTSEKFFFCEYENCGTLVDDPAVLIDDLYCSLECKIRKQTVTEEENFIDEISNPTEKSTVDRNFSTKLINKINEKKQLKTFCPEENDNSKEQVIHVFNEPSKEENQPLLRPLLSISYLEAIDDDNNYFVLKVEDKDVLKYITGFQHKSAPIQFFDNPYPTKKNLFVVGEKLEGIDPKYEALFCVMTVSEVCGYRIKLHFDGYGSEYDFWVNADCPDLFHAGWCEMNSRILQPPFNYGNVFNWTDYLRECQAVPAPKCNFVSSTNLNSCRSSTKFHIGNKMEALDKLTRTHPKQLIYVATVADILGNRIRIHFDGWTDDFDYWADITSIYIHPIGWCEKNGRTLLPPKYYKAKKGRKIFNWTEYLAETNSEPVPEDAFVRRPLRDFSNKMIIEVFDLVVPRLLRISKVVDVRGDELKIVYDGFDNDYAYWVEDDSPDIHPVGWSSKINHPIELPPASNTRWSCNIRGCKGYGNSSNHLEIDHVEKKDCPYEMDAWKNAVAGFSNVPDRLKTHNIVINSTLTR